LGYISIGEDLRTLGITSEQMLKDKRFKGDGTGPRVNLFLQMNSIVPIC